MMKKIDVCIDFEKICTFEDEGIYIELRNAVSEHLSISLNRNTMLALSEIFDKYKQDKMPKYCWKKKCAECQKKHEDALTEKE